MQETLVMRSASPGRHARRQEIYDKRVSVIIPVYDDAQRLRLCLECLAQQRYPADGYEVIVVDNGSEEPLEPLCNLYPGTKLVRAPQPGSYAARNLGIVAAEGDILLFTDSDCLPDPEWIETAVRIFRNGDGSNILGGEIRIFPRNETSQTLSEWHQGIRGFVQERNVQFANYSVTANLAVRRHVFDAVGLFDDRLLSGADLEWGQRAAATGERPIYVPDLIVRHPARSSLSELLARSARTAGGNWARARLKGESRWHLVLATLAAPWKHLLHNRHHPRLQTFRDRTVFLGLEILIASVRLWECLRLGLGGRPRRR